MLNGAILPSQLFRWQYELADIFVYFKDDQGGHAIKNAKSLQKFLLLEVLGAKLLKV
jgi:uncharacterized protein YecE (DUF72 family)